MIKIIIIHFQPLEYYPPIQNLVKYIENEFNLKVITTGNSRNLNEFKSSKSQILRFIVIRKSDGKITRFIKYLYFNLLSVIYIIKSKPGKLLYFETDSSFPCYIIKKYLFKKIPVYIHYHEYFDIAYYRKGMKLNLFYHNREFFLYKKADWISHTNKYRLALFNKEHPYVNDSILKVLPNYPPKDWYTKIKRLNNEIAYPIKLVYIGALSMISMYVEELFLWINKQEGKFLLDIYSSNIMNDVFDFLKKSKCSYIKYIGKLNYNNIPFTLEKYDVGIIFYKNYSLNVKFCASNKLFEYLACNLDVWFSSFIEGTYDYINVATYPKVIPVDFEKLEDFDYLKAIDRKNIKYKPYNFNCEDALAELKNGLNR